MNKDEFIRMLQTQNAYLQQQLEESNHKVDILLQDVAELKALLVQKNAEEQKQKNIIRGLTKIQQNKSEKQTPAASAGKEEQKPEKPKPRLRTNYGARALRAGGRAGGRLS